MYSSAGISLQQIPKWSNLFLLRLLPLFCTHFIQVITAQFRDRVGIECLREKTHEAGSIPQSRQVFFHIYKKEILRQVLCRAGVAYKKVRTGSIVFLIGLFWTVSYLGVKTSLFAKHFVMKDVWSVRLFLCRSKSVFIQVYEEVYMTTCFEAERNGNSKIAYVVCCAGPFD